MPGMDVHEQFMTRAVALSRKKAVEEKDGGPFAAIIVKGGQVIAEGWNRVIKDNDPTRHGEVDAIRKACTVLKSHTLEGCVMYTSCAPCPMCASVVWYTRLDKVYYGITTLNFKTLSDYSGLFKDVTLPYEQRSTPYEQVFSQEAVAHQVFVDWSKVAPEDPSLHGKPH